VTWRKRQREDPEINMASLVDVVFLLLLFFMVSSTFEHITQLDIELPKAKTGAKEEQQMPIDVVIDAQGHYYVNDRRLVNTQPETLKEAISRAMGDRKNPPFIIDADAMTPHQAVVAAMDAARQLGISHVSIGTRNNAAGQPQ
jgi:biopolymer transport protein ExbD